MCLTKCLKFGHLPFKSSLDVALLLLSLEDEEEEDMLSKEAFKENLYAKETCFLSPQTEVFSLTDVEVCGSHSNSSQGAVKQCLELNCSESAYLRHSLTEGQQTMVTIVAVHGCSALFSQL